MIQGNTNTGLSSQDAHTIASVIVCYDVGDICAGSTSGNAGNDIASIAKNWQGTGAYPGS